MELEAGRVTRTHARDDIFERMGDVELMGELRRILLRSAREMDRATADAAKALFGQFYVHCVGGVRGTVPQRLWQSARDFVRDHA